MTLLFSHPLQVRFRDCDAMGHVNNAVYLTYLEEARFAHWRSIHAGVEAPSVILARIEVDYRRAATFGDLLEIRILLDRIGTSSLAYRYEILDQSGALVAEAKSVLVAFDYSGNKPVAIPDDVRARILNQG